MKRIKVLTDHVANQIAAGEVIERPAAVIKELVENSLDAGAKRIKGEFRNGGKSYMRVEDDGSGMSRDDALLCLERHATSKIENVDELDRVKTFGFRGEAIPSIASISRFTLRTRANGTSTGCEVLVNAGKLLHCKEYGMPCGTQIEVVNLFNSVPVRRKFMKTENTEAAHIIYLMRLYALGHPEVGFSLIEDGREVFKSPICSNLNDRVSGVWNRKLDQELIEIEAEEAGMRMYGLIGKPGVGRSTRQEMITFVNKRPVDSKTLNYALIETYHTYLPKGRFPVAFLFLEVDPQEVDVNVHPAKREVRFRNDGLVRQFIITSVLTRLKDLREGVRTEAIAKFAVERQPEIEPAISQPQAQPIAILLPVVRPLEIVKRDPIKVFEEGENVQFEEKQDNIIKIPEEWRYIGQISGGYALFEATGGLIVMSCKRAKQRVLYEQIQEDFKREGEGMSQLLLFPIPISMDPLLSASLEEHLTLLNRGGFKIELFGRNFYRVEAVPGWLDPGLAEEFVRDVAGLIKEQGGIPNNLDLMYEKIAKLVVTQTLKFDKGVDGQSADRLAKQLIQCENPNTCPRGMPTYFEVSYGDLSRRFD